MKTLATTTTGRTGERKHLVKTNDGYAIAVSTVTHAGEWGAAVRRYDITRTLGWVALDEAFARFDAS